MKYRVYPKNDLLFLFHTPDQLPPHSQLLPNTFYTLAAGFIATLDLITILYLERLVVISKRDFFFFLFAKISQTKMVNGLIFFSELFNYAAF